MHSSCLLLTVQILALQKQLGPNSFDALAAQNKEQDKWCTGVQWFCYELQSMRQSCNQHFDRQHNLLCCAGGISRLPMHALDNVAHAPQLRHNICMYLRALSNSKRCQARG